VRCLYVYILASTSGVLHVGVTNNPRRRVHEHRSANHGFTAKYRLNRLLYFETCENPLAAIATEREIMGWVRERKLQLVEAANRDWRDLSEAWGNPRLSS